MISDHWETVVMPEQKQEKWDRRYLELAKHIASWSKDPSTQVGAVLVDDKGCVVGTGYNGFPREVLDEEQRYADRELKYKLVVHAELNAILQAGHRAAGCTLYVWPAFSLPPICNECCKAVIQAGITHVVGYNPTDDERNARWAESIKLSRLMCREAGVYWRSVQPA